MKTLWRKITYTYDENLPLNEVKILAKFVSICFKNVSTTDIISSYEIHSSYLQVIIYVSKK